MMHPTIVVSKFVCRFNTILDTEINFSSPLSNLLTWNETSAVFFWYKEVKTKSSSKNLLVLIDKLFLRSWLNESYH